MSGPQSTPSCAPIAGLADIFVKQGYKDAVSLYEAISALIRQRESALSEKGQNAAPHGNTAHESGAQTDQAHAGAAPDDKLDGMLTREQIERIRAAFRCFSEDDEQKRRLDSLCNMALSALSATDAIRRECYATAAEICRETAAQFDTDLPQPGDLDFKRGALSCKAEIEKAMGAIDSGRDK